ncbi:hypothetical protein D3C80_1670500 [compost metagenome]
MLILHHFYHAINRFLAEILITAAGQTVCLVNEQDAAECFFNQIAGLLCGMPDIFTDQIRALHFNQMPFAEHTHPLEQLGDNSGDSGLAGPGITLKYHMVHMMINLETHFLSYFLDL